MTAQSSYMTAIEEHERMLVQVQPWAFEELVAVWSNTGYCSNPRNVGSNPALLYISEQWANWESHYAEDVEFERTLVVRVRLAPLNNGGKQWK